jgi:hypothetical protein
VRFFPNGGTSYSMSLDSIKKIAIYISDKYGKNRFNQNELEMERDFFVKNFKSNLSEEDYAILLGALTEWVKTG